MLNRIRQWLLAHPRCTLILLAALMLGPFLAKPFNLDDPLFIWLAKQAQAHPENPFGFDVNWYGVWQPMWTVTENPPLAGYYFALAGSIFGWSEFGLHLAGLLAAVAVVLGTYQLAGHFCGKPMLAAVAVMCAPLFLVSANTVMCDMVMLAFWVWAVVYWIDGVEQDRTVKIIAAGVLIAMAFLTKYTGLALLPLLAVHGLMRKHRLGMWIAGLIIPLVVLGAYQAITLALYGHPLVSAAVGYANSVQGELGFSKLSASFIALAFTGGGVVAGLFLAPWLWRPRTLTAIVFGTVILGGALCASGLFMKKYPALETPAMRMGISAQLILWAAGGALVLALAAGDVWRNRRDACSWLLALWVVGTLAFAALVNWTVNGRSLLPMVPAAGILLARRWEAGGPRRPQALQFGLAASGLLALLVAQSDFQLAVVVRRSAEEACARCARGQGTVWFEGHWGFQYYMEKLGAKSVDFKHARQLPGDFLVLPAHNTDTYRPSPEIVAHGETLNLPGPSLLTTWNAAAGAGFYASVVGPLPFGFGHVPSETVYVYELRAAVPGIAK